MCAPSYRRYVRCLYPIEAYCDIPQFALVGGACTLGLLIECTLLLYDAFGRTNNITTVVALVLLIVIEIVPAIALIVTMHQPPNPSAPQGCIGDTFCFMFAERSYFAMKDINPGK